MPARRMMVGSFTALVVCVGLLPAQVLGPGGQPDPGHPDLQAWYAAWQGVNAVAIPVDGWVAVDPDVQR